MSDAIDFSNAAMEGPRKTPRRGSGRPKDGGYYLSDGTRVPSVTSILGRFKDPGPLMKWAAKVAERQGYAHGKHGVPPAGIYGDKAAEIGTLVHHAAENFIHRDPFAFDTARAEYGGDLSDEQIKRAIACFAEFLEWWDMVQPDSVATETPLVSERHRYGGTNDYVARLGRSRVLAVLDFKTSARVYLDHKVQLGALVELWNENHGDGEQIDRAVCLRFDKTAGSFTHEKIGADALRRYFVAFMHLRDAHEILYGY